MLSRLTPRDRLILALTLIAGDLFLVAVGLLIWRDQQPLSALIAFGLAVLYGLAAVALVHSLLRPGA